MRPFESKTHSFIVKIWREETSDAGSARWRGHVTHVPDGERRYVQSLDEISAFIGPYLGGMNVKRHLFRRLTRWVESTKARIGKT